MVILVWGTLSLDVYLIYLFCLPIAIWAVMDTVGTQPCGPLSLPSLSS